MIYIILRMISLVLILSSSFISGMTSVAETAKYFKKSFDELQEEEQTLVHILGIIYTRMTNESQYVDYKSFHSKVVEEIEKNRGDLTQETADNLHQKDPIIQKFYSYFNQFKVKDPQETMFNRISFCAGYKDPKKALRPKRGN